MNRRNDRQNAAGGDWRGFCSVSVGNGWEAKAVICGRGFRAGYVRLKDMASRFSLLVGLVTILTIFGGGIHLGQPPKKAQPAQTTYMTELKGPTGLIIPVAGVRAAQLRDNYVDARGEGRTHNALDIMAARSTPVVAAADGEIARLFYSDRGGITIYQWSADRQYIFYYAHLERYVEGLAAGRKVRQGETIGYVGDTGNAGTGNYHLHFSIWLVTDPKRYWEGLNINPYPLLRN
jgi:murein DD-endopeptidase MepM/ murein hydrolase activator NlpD